MQREIKKLLEECRRHDLGITMATKENEAIIIVLTYILSRLPSKTDGHLNLME